MRYRKKPVVIEAVQWTGDNIADVSSLAMDSKNEIDVVGMQGGSLGINISTLEGEMTASIGDFIIKGVNGELYPCKADIFAKTYEPVCEGCKHWSIKGQDCTLINPETGCPNIPARL